MPALYFPSTDFLRRALAGGVVPAAVAMTPARIRIAAGGGLWLEPSDPLSRTVLAGLTRLGVRGRASGGPLTERLGCWAEVFPLVSSPVRPSGVVLVELPARRLAAFARTVRRRTAAPIGVGLAPGDGPARAWLTTSNPPPEWLAPDDEPDVEVFAEAAPGVWVRVGWEHPLPHLLAPPPGGCLILRPPRAVAEHPVLPPKPTSDEFSVAGRSLLTPASCRPVIRQPLTLAPSSEVARESLWVWPRDADGPFREFCRTAGERQLRGLDVATAGGRVVVRRAAGRGSAAVPVPDRGYWPHPRAAGLFLPTGFDLRPSIRASRLARLLDLCPERTTWVEREPDGEVSTHSVPVTAFRPLAGTVEYSAPVTVPVSGGMPAAEPFALAALPTPVVEEQAPAVAPGPPAEPATPAVATGPQPGWLARSLGRLANRFARPPAPPPKPSPLLGRKQPADRTTRRVESTSAELVHGHDPVARRHRLEARLMSAGAADRSALWADLATTYQDAGTVDDAAVCWVNAVWEADPPPVAWVEQWYEAECRAAGITAPPDGPGPLAPARVAATTICRAAGLGVVPADLPAVRAALNAGADDLPVRAAWLAAVAAARLGGGDALGLARWRDRLLARLGDRGPGLDLDAPSFLRFHGAADPDRFGAARAWLVRARRPVLSWVGRLGKPGRLQWAGIDPETGCTSAYAQLLLAWGLAALGDGRRSRDWAGRACKVLTSAAAPGADPGVHAVLADALLGRVREAREGRPARPGLPVEAIAHYDRLPEFARYAVDKFRRFSRVLEPADRVRDYGGREFGGLWGADRVGDRLAHLIGPGDPMIPAEVVRQHLAEATADPAGDALPRVVFALLELAPRLDPVVLPELLAAVPSALDLVGRLVDGGGRSAGEAAALRSAVLGRLVEYALTAAAASPRPATARPLVADLFSRVARDPDVRVALTRSAGPVFRSLRALGYRREATALLAALDPDQAAWPAESPLPPHRLGLAAGWFAVGDDEAGNRLLDDARGRLFDSREGDDRDRTELAVAYAEAVGWGPPGPALGRLDELFQLLGRVAVTGSTNRYYTLQPLRLIDRAVRAVVGDDFAPGPAVRAWLADDEFLTRGRIHRDMAAALRDGGVG